VKNPNALVANEACQTLIHSVGDQKSLLGFFSVNLRKALGAAGNADSPENAHAVKEAVEFFAFGVSQKIPLNTCSGH
jgi:hypothetical protein